MRFKQNIESGKVYPRIYLHCRSTPSVFKYMCFSFLSLGFYCLYSFVSISIKRYVYVLHRRYMTCLKRRSLWRIKLHSPLTVPRRLSNRFPIFMYVSLSCVSCVSFMFYIFILFKIHAAPSPPLCFLLGLCVFVGRRSLCMLYHMHDLLFILSYSTGFK